MTGDKLTVPHRVGEAPAGAIGTLISGDPMVVAASMPVRDAATVMTERGFAALIVGIGDGFGVLTDVGIRADVVARGLDLRRPSATSSGHRCPRSPPIPGGDHARLVLRTGLTCVPVVDAEGALLGSVTAADLLSALPDPA